MNCFEWQNRASDYLDGTLMGGAKTEADDHLDSCRDCSQRYEHFRVIVTSIASQSRSSLPVPIRRSPLAVALPRVDMARLGRSRWEQIPWWLRTSLEGVGIVLMILLGISTGPRLRSLYEQRVERSLSEFRESFSNPDDSSRIPLARGVNLALDGESGASRSDEFASGDEAEEDGEDEGEAGGPVSTSDDADQEIRVGSSEIWRFILKTDSPHEVRPQIVRLLTELKVPANTPGLGGIEAPGGIQFDLVVPQHIIPGLKRQLQAMAPKAPQELAQTPAGETFTWYKNKSKRALPDRKTRIVIWLSQM